MTRYRVTHTTRYHYSEPVSQCQNEAHLRLRSTPRQYCEDDRLEVQPQPAVRQDRQDFFGNRVTYFAVQEPHVTLSVTAHGRVRIDAGESPELARSPAWETVPQCVAGAADPAGFEARQFLLESPLIADSPAVAAYAAPSFSSGRPVLEAVADLIGRIAAEFTYEPDVTSVATPIHVVLEQRRGVCQDFAHLVIGCLRNRRIPARYVSGYVETAPPDDQYELTGAAASHAWVSVYCPGQGWIDFDPTNNCIPCDQHISVAWGRDYGDVTPLKGVVTGGGEHSLEVTVSVERLA